jgi:hypothetical protein
LSVRFTKVAAVVQRLLEEYDGKRLHPGHTSVPATNGGPSISSAMVQLSQLGAELLFEIFSQRYERGSMLMTNNLRFDEWTSIFGSKPDRRAARPADPPRAILEMNGEGHHLTHSSVASISRR